MWTNCILAFSLLFLLQGLTQAKVAKKDHNVIATFSEDDISDKLPKPEAVAAQIPKKMILSNSRKPIAASKNVKVDSLNLKSEKTVKSTKPTKTANDSKLKKSRKSLQTDDKSDHLDRKSKSMKVGTDDDDNDEDGSGDDENFIVVETPLNSLPVETDVKVPTATLVNLLEDKIDTSQGLHIALIKATTTPNSDEPIITSLPAQRVRKFKPRNRMDAKIADASSGGDISVKFGFLLMMSLITIVIANI